MHAERQPVPFTYREFALLPEDGNKRWELIDGDFFVSPAPSSRHQTVSRKLQQALMTQLEDPGIAQVFDAPVDVILTDTDVVEPDLVIIRDPERVSLRGIEGAPDVIIEILSPFNPERDRYLKKALYARCGVPEYLIVDPAFSRVEVWELAFIPREQQLGALVERPFEIGEASLARERDGSNELDRKCRSSRVIGGSHDPPGVRGRPFGKRVRDAG